MGSVKDPAAAAPYVGAAGRGSAAQRPSASMSPRSYQRSIKISLHFFPLGASSFLEHISELVCFLIRETNFVIKQISHGDVCTAR